MVKAGLPMAALLACWAEAAAAEPGIFKACTIDSVSVCTPRGCAASKPAISIFVSDFLDHGTERGGYYRCGLGLRNCDRYRALVYRTGGFLIFSLPERGVFAKLASDNSVTDVATLADTVFVSRGECTNAAPPPASSWRSQ